ncbi:recombinase family protein [Spirosoma utsteinense]|uniref:recombinase family protein n=1 Tax=Spirosoma utsteinense TaxID=2585773 RepID=UPI0016446A9F
MTPVALFVRVSTKEQDYARQVADLTAHTERQGYEIVHIIHETGSATKRSNVDRPELDKLLDLCRRKLIRKVLVTEFSRLGRRRSETPALMEAITQAGVSIYAHNLGLETLLANGKRNPVASIVIAVMIEPGGFLWSMQGKGNKICHIFLLASPLHTLDESTCCEPH